MGDLTDDVVEGLACSLCGVYFVKPHGFPVLCGNCWADATRMEKLGLVRAEHHEA